MENALWEVSPIVNKNFGVDIQQFLAIVINAYSFLETTRVESLLRKLCRSYTSTEIDWREMLCGLQMLAMPALLCEKPEKLFESFFRLYATPESPDIAARKDICTLISLGASTPADFVETKGALEKIIPATSRRVHIDTLRLVFNEHKHILNAFQRQLWSQISYDARLHYLKSIEDASNARLRGYMHTKNVQQANKLQSDILYARAYRRWCLYVKQMHIFRARRRKVLARLHHNSLLWWRHYTVKRQAARSRRRIATVMGGHSRSRRILVRWRRYLYNDKRILHAIGTAAPVLISIQHAFSFLRRAHALYTKRRRLWQWYQFSCDQRHWHMAIRNYRKVCFTKHLYAWHEVTHKYKRARQYESQANFRQQELFFVLKQADEIREARLQAEAEAVETQKRILFENDKKAAKYAENLAEQRRIAQRAANDRLKIAVQKDARERHRHVLLEKQKTDFDAHWAERERTEVEEHKVKTEEWLESKEATNAILKEFTRIKREFYRPPTPRSMDREARLKSLAAIVLIKLESLLFQQGQLLEDVIAQYSQARGYLSHEDFRKLVSDLPVELSAEQVRHIIREIDADDDGYIDLTELNRALDIVHQYNGMAASPWRQYIDPAQDVMCYSNVHTGEHILEHRMTDKKLLEITRANYLAQAELDAIKDVRQKRDDAWIFIGQNSAALTIAGAYRKWRARRALGRIRWKIAAQMEHRQKEKEAAAAICIQCWVRWRLALYKFSMFMQLHVEAIPDLDQRQIYYYNHMSGTVSWNPPTCKGTTRLPHLPHDFVGTGPWIYWRDSRNAAKELSLVSTDALRRIFQKPPGYPLCSQCATNLALLQCDMIPGAFCFACFRESLDMDAFLEAGYTHTSITRVKPATCSFCVKRIAGWRYIGEVLPKLHKKPACQTCHDRLLVGHPAQEADAWVRI